MGGNEQAPPSFVVNPRRREAAARGRSESLMPSDHNASTVLISQFRKQTAKAGVVGFTRSLARALGPDGITVNVVKPGLTASPNAIATFGTERIESAGGLRALPRAQLPTDVVGATLFLASSLSDFITG